MGGMHTELIELSAKSDYNFTGNYVLVLDGACKLDDSEAESGTLIVGETVEPRSFAIAAANSERCFVLGVGFSR